MMLVQKFLSTRIQPVKAVFNRFFQCWNCNMPPISGSPYFDSHQIWMTDHDFRWTSCRSTSNAVAGSIGSGHPVWRDREFVRRGIGGTSFFWGATLGGLDSQGIPTGLGGIFLKGKSGIHMAWCCLLFQPLQLEGIYNSDVTSANNRELTNGVAAKMSFEVSGCRKFFIWLNLNLGFFELSCQEN